jgi:hypothetical protein
MDVDVDVVQQSLLTGQRREEKRRGRAVGLALDIDADVFEGARVDI